MNKTIAVLALAALALLPSKSAWADAAKPAPEHAAVTDSAQFEIGTASAARELFAYGCRGGLGFKIYYEDATFTFGGYFVGVGCGLSPDFIRLA